MLTDVMRADTDGRLARAEETGGREGGVAALDAWPSLLVGKHFGIVRLVSFQHLLWDGGRYLSHCSGVLSVYLSECDTNAVRWLLPGSVERKRGLENQLVFGRALDFATPLPSD